GMCPAAYSACLACGRAELGCRPRTSSTRTRASLRFSCSQSAVTSGPSGAGSSGGIGPIALPFLAHRPTCSGGRLCPLGPGNQVLPGDLADQLGMIGAHVRLDHRRRVLHGFAASEVPALAPDDLRHDPSPVRERDSTAAGLHASAILLAPTLADNPATRIQL